ncbi:hypothetical protein NIES2109_18350 [Nostoc sp. HK-01]|uniref:Uncharacterized protein n=1 Tax=Anabaenopsis circularis NIES-21 TaxID=1085406 RepID=A0A1Z4GH66_9CYAN|nr:hypothetical protein NIES21_26630 [Anabaenopsis circularis NIES-21]BBD59056.1 hypothetical protein NIES2109_18350 [Nostoc sp. HK-01]
MKIWSKLRILLLAVNLGCIILVLVNVIQKESSKKPKLEEYRSQVFLGESQT